MQSPPRLGAAMASAGLMALGTATALAAILVAGLAVVDGSWADEVWTSSDFSLLLVVGGSTLISISCLVAPVWINAVMQGKEADGFGPGPLMLTAGLGCYAGFSVTLLLSSLIAVPLSRSVNGGILVLGTVLGCGLSFVAVHWQCAAHARSVGRRPRVGGARRGSTRR